MQSVARMATPKADISPPTAIATRAGPVAMGLRMVALAAAAAIVVIVGWQEITADWTPWIGWLFVAQSDDGVEAGGFEGGPHAEKEAHADGDHKPSDD